MQSKTSETLLRVIDQSELVYQYDELRTTFKDTGTKREELQRISAMIDVRLCSTYKAAKTKLLTLERAALENNNCLSLVPTDELELVLYNETLKKLSILEKLRAHFSFSL